MEFKAIIYVVIAVFWLFSRFFQKEKESPVSGAGTKPRVLPAERSPETVRRLDSPTGQQRKLFTEKTKAVARQVRVPATVSLETPVHPVIAPSRSKQDQDQTATPGITVYVSDAERISDEIKNGQMDWRRALIISELLNRKSGF